MSLPAVQTVYLISIFYYKKKHIHILELKSILLGEIDKFKKKKKKMVENRFATFDYISKSNQNSIHGNRMVPTGYQNLFMEECQDRISKAVFTGS